MTVHHRKVVILLVLYLRALKILCHLMPNKILSIDAELGKDQIKDLEMSKPNDAGRFTSQVLYKSPSYVIQP